MTLSQAETIIVLVTDCNLQFSTIHEPWPLMNRLARRVPALQANSDLFDNLKWIKERWILGIFLYVPTSIIAFILLPIYPFIARILKNPATLKSPIACRLNSWVMNSHQLFHQRSSESLTVRITFVSFWVHFWPIWPGFHPNSFHLKLTHILWGLRNKVLPKESFQAYLDSHQTPIHHI